MLKNLLKLLKIQRIQMYFYLPIPVFSRKGLKYLLYSKAYRMISIISNLTKLHSKTFKV